MPTYFLFITRVVDSSENHTIRTDQKYNKQSTEAKHVERCFVMSDSNDTNKPVYPCSLINVFCSAV